MAIVLKGLNYCKRRFLKNQMKAIKIPATQARRFCNVRKVLGIETSCDDTGAAVVDETGHILGESLNSQSRLSVE